MKGLALAGMRSVSLWDFYRTALPLFPCRGCSLELASVPSNCLSLTRAPAQSVPPFARASSGDCVVLLAVWARRARNPPEKSTWRCESRVPPAPPNMLLALEGRPIINDVPEALRLEKLRGVFLDLTDIIADRDVLDRQEKERCAVFSPVQVWRE
ncbi:hypothetical protein SKAU_G00247640 [Synaphobranchus kaupii]|uniref:Uncharacterized protein n=1 Tax=Synaphobranchus kaupii TaxID=118154 RepID=A0A9Q1F276_SYNKA|nr:hypothetical protein SKAU_G00247640 [Synaphobranchus kaupii]